MKYFLFFFIFALFSGCNFLNLDKRDLKYEESISNQDSKSYLAENSLIEVNGKYKYIISLNDYINELQPSPWYKKPLGSPNFFLSSENELYFTGGGDTNRIEFLIVNEMGYEIPLYKNFDYIIDQNQILKVGSEGKFIIQPHGILSPVVVKRYINQSYQCELISRGSSIVLTSDFHKLINVYSIKCSNHPFLHLVNSNILALRKSGSSAVTYESVTNQLFENNRNSLDFKNRIQVNLYGTLKYKDTILSSEDIPYSGFIFYYDSLTGRLN